MVVPAAAGAAAGGLLRRYEGHVGLRSHRCVVTTAVVADRQAVLRRRIRLLVAATISCNATSSRQSSDWLRHHCVVGGVDQVRSGFGGRRRSRPASHRRCRAVATDTASWPVPQLAPAAPRGWPPRVRVTGQRVQINRRGAPRGRPGIGPPGPDPRLSPNRQLELLPRVVPATPATQRHPACASRCAAHRLILCTW